MVQTPFIAPAVGPCDSLDGAAVAFAIIVEPGISPSSRSFSFSIFRKNDVSKPLKVSISVFPNLLLLIYVRVRGVQLAYFGFIVDNDGWLHIDVTTCIVFRDECCAWDNEIDHSSS